MNQLHRPSRFHSFLSKMRKPTKDARSASSEGLSWSRILLNYRVYRAEMRLYKAQQKQRKAQLKKQLREERKNELGNPFFQLFYAKERSRKIFSDAEGNVLYVPSVLNSVIHIFNSTVSFIVAYLLVYLIYQFAVILLASFQEIYGVLYYYQVDFNDHSTNWTVLNIIAITLSGPLVSLSIGLYFYNSLFFKAKQYATLRLFYYWVGLHGMAFFFAAFISGVITNKGFGYVPLWLFWNDFTRFFFALLALVGLGLIGYFSAARLQATSNNSFRIVKENRALFFMHQSLIPFLLGSALILVVKMPNNQAYDTLILVFGSILSLAVLFNLDTPNYPLFRSNNRAMFNFSLFLLTLVLLYIWRIFLADGLHFFVQFIIKVTPL